MSGGLDVLALKEEDITKFLACSTHLGAANVDCQMEQYVYKRKPDGMYCRNVGLQLLNQIGLHIDQNRSSLQEGH